MKARSWLWWLGIMLCATGVAHGSSELPELREKGFSWGEAIEITVAFLGTWYFLNLIRRAWWRRRERKLFEAAMRGKCRVEPPHGG